MEDLWSDAKANEYVAKYEGRWGKDLALRTYLAALIGAQESLVLHGGGNSSVKTSARNILGEEHPILFVKASGYDMAGMEPEGYSGLDLAYLMMLRALPDLSDEDMANELCTHLCNSHAAAPSIETLMHAFLPKKFIDHTHADAVLTLTNQKGGEELIREALGPEVLILGYITPGFKLAQAAVTAFEANPESKAMILMHHGLICWGDTASESYRTTIDLITRAEQFLSRRRIRTVMVTASTPLEEAQKRLAYVAPMLRGLLASPSADPDWPYARSILLPLISREVLDFVDSSEGKELALSPPLTADHLIRTKAFPLWIDDPPYSDPEELRMHIAEALQKYSASYDAYIARHAHRMPKNVSRSDPLPRVVFMPGLGAICAARDAVAANIVKDIASHTIAVKAQIACMNGIYCGAPEQDLFDMEYRSFQQAKLRQNHQLPLAREVALITGAAGAIGSGIAKELLEQGCHVAVTDLPGKPLDDLVEELGQTFGPKVIGVHLDVTDPDSVRNGFIKVIRTWGGVDLVVINHGSAHVSSIAEMSLPSFRTLERINAEGTLLVLAEAGNHFKIQNTGGDIVLISTKNIVAPGAKFGAYSATKAAAHQLARIASLEYAPIGVRVNMVAPDAVFSAGQRKSGLWETVGPDRARSRGLNPDALEDFYRNRNLLKTRITARHVAKAVLFFATHQTPTTGATIPVDGGLPEATPR